MSTSNLGRLEKLSLRKAWSSESGDFTPWLAKSENLTLLGESIGLDLLYESHEKRVGPFRADIFCKDASTDTRVLIENQLECTDHKHLGQLLTYAAGLDAVTIVWVAEKFTEEHRAALDWLNERTDEKINCFGLEVELWRTGDSPPAPKFNVVCKPNEWARVVSDTAKSIEAGNLSDYRQLQYQYWKDFLVLLRSRKQVVEARTPQASHWMGFPVGKTDFRLFVEMYVKEDAIGAGVTFKAPHGRYYLDRLVQQSKEVERELGEKLIWDAEDKRAQNYLGVYLNCDPTDKKDWPRQHAWLADKLERLQKKIGERLKRLPPPR